MADTGYLFQGTTIGDDGIFYDGQNVPELLYALQKKFFGSANIVIDKSYLSVTYGGDHTVQQPNAYIRTHQTSLYAQKVPFNNPFFIPINNIITFSNYQIIDWSNYNYYCYNTPMSNDNNSKKYICCNYPYIAYYESLLLTCIKYTENTGYYKNYDTTYTHPLLQNAISSTYDNSYPLSLYSDIDSRDIPPIDGSWTLDTDAGVITFYDLNISITQVSRSNPPRISFFRYEGLFGEANILEGQDL